MSGDRTKFKKEKKLIYGLHPEGILEIKIHDPKKKNAFFLQTMVQFQKVFQLANEDDRVKCIVLHGGEDFSAGNDIEAFEIGREDVEEVDEVAKDLINKGLVAFCDSFLLLEKPLVVLVKGLAIGIGFTILSMADFVYCTSTAKFFTPFMQSFQSPEGGSTVMFPKLFGPRFANELILQDRLMTAKEAFDYGFVNGVLSDIPKGDFFDLMKLPCIPKLIKNDVQTMVTAKRLFMQGLDKDHMKAVFRREGDALHKIWLDPRFPDKMMAYLLSLNNKPVQRKKKATKASATSTTATEKAKERPKL